MIYLDNGATSYPKPKNVYKVYENTIKSYFSNPGRAGYENCLKTAEKVFEVRQKTADFFGCSTAENVVFTHNCTTALNMVIKGVLKRGDHALVSDLEHNSVVRPLEKLRRENKIKYDKFRVDYYDDEATLCDIEEKIKPETKLLICTHASNVLGVALPVEKIGKLCREHHILFALDAAQSAGIMPIDMRQYSLNFLCLACHKGLFASMGTGALLTDGTALETLLEGGTGSLSANAAQPAFMPDRLESGTENISGILTLGAGLDFIDSVSRERIHQKEMGLLLRFYDAFRDEKRMIFYCDYSRMRQFSAALSFNIVGKTSEETALLLDRSGIAVRAGLHCAPAAHRKIGTLETGTVRISPSFFTTNDEINYTISTIKKYI